MHRFRCIKGVTLVELAIVIVIIGFLIGVVLKGRELIVNSKIKNLVHQVKAVEIAVQTYLEKYKALPGDDQAIAKLRFTPAALVEGNADGVISGAEEFMVPHHLQRAELITGAYNDGTTQHMVHKFGGDLVVTTITDSIVQIEGGTPITRRGNCIIIKGLPYDVARSIDVIMDDGTRDNGSVLTPALFDGSTPVVDLYYFF